MAYPEALKMSNNKRSYDLDSRMGSLSMSSSPEERQIARVLRIKFSQSSLYGLQMEVEIRKGDTTQLEEKWMDQEECEGMKGYDGALEAYRENKRQMCRE